MTTKWYLPFWFYIILIIHIHFAFPRKERGENDSNEIVKRKPEQGFQTNSMSDWLMLKCKLIKLQYNNHRFSKKKNTPIILTFDFFLHSIRRELWWLLFIEFNFHLSAVLISKLEYFFLLFFNQRKIRIEKTNSEVILK